MTVVIKVMTASLRVRALGGRTPSVVLVEDLLYDRTPGCARFPVEKRPPLVSQTRRPTCRILRTPRYGNPIEKLLRDACARRIELIYKRESLLVTDPGRMRFTSVHHEATAGIDRRVPRVPRDSGNRDYNAYVCRAAAATAPRTRGPGVAC
jgi:hypothetical protein